jgi:DNA-binding beta-propeller fold protein YncE
MFYTGGYQGDIHVIDERTLELVDRIETQHEIIGRFTISPNRKRLYVWDGHGINIEVIDLAERRSVDSFNLTDVDPWFRIRGLSVNPQETYALIVGKSRTKLLDRFEIGPNTIIRYDLQRHEVRDTIPWPDGHVRERGASFMFSPDGSLVYYQAEDMIVLESENFTEVDRWRISDEVEPGLGTVRPPLTESYYEEPGLFTGLVRVTDPINNRRMMGIARVNLAEKEMDFYTLGPNRPVSRFALAPGGKKAWALYTEIGHYEFWAIDLEEGRVTEQVRFDGRSRMGLTVSTNGELLYIHVAGNTIDVYDSETYEHLKTVDVGTDMIGWALVPGTESP